MSLGVSAVRSAIACPVLVASVLFAPVRAQTPSPLDIAKVEAAFAEAKQISDADGGRLWGLKLYGAMYFVDPATRTVVANEPDNTGVLHKDGDVYVGTLPESVLVADSPIEWGGKRWTMLRWPPPAETLTQHINYAHEMFHRIQPALHLDAPDSPNLQLDTAEGRLWLQLEWRALAAALVEHGPAQVQAIRDALAFRLHRRALFAGSAKTEDNLEIAEGVPEYTGVVAGSPDRDTGRWRTIGKLDSPDTSFSFVRYFAYTSGPAYGLLLDERAPGWRAKLAKDSDLGLLLAATLKRPVQDDAVQRAAFYGAAGIRMEEADRSAKADAEKARYRARLVDGPTLTLPDAGHFHFSFNPSTLVSLGDAGTVYPTFQLGDAWGSLAVTDGVLVPTNFSKATVAAPTDTKGPHLSGPGWTLDLAPGWSLAPAGKPGNYTLRKD